MVCDSSVSAEARFFFDCINDCCLTQHVDFLTTDKPTLDLLFSGEPDLVCNVQDLGNFSSSDHKLIFCNLEHSLFLSPTLSSRCDTAQRSTLVWS